MEHDGSLSVRSKGGIKGWMESMFMMMSQTSVGLPIVKFIDYFLNVVEKSTQWSLPAHEFSAEENGKVFGKIELLRPLPWILFLPGLVILRIIRGGLNVGAFILGYPQIEAIKMVKFVQKFRRRLRTLNLKAMKSTRHRVDNNEDKILIRSIRLTLSSLFCLDSSKLSPSPPPIRICVTGLDFDTTTTPDEMSTTESASSSILTDRKRKLSQVSSDSDDETVLTMIEKYASVNSEDDSDFNPAECNVLSSSSSASEDEEENNISASEMEDIKKDTEEFLNNSRLTSNALPLDKTTCYTEKETAMEMNETRVDSLESETQIDARETNDFINEEVQDENRDTMLTVPEYIQESSSAVKQDASPHESEAAPSLSTHGVIAATEERDEAPSQEPKSSNTKDGTWHAQDRKYKPSKKQSGRYTTKQEKRFLKTGK